MWHENYKGNVMCDTASLEQHNFVSQTVHGYKLTFYHKINEWELSHHSECVFSSQLSK